MIVVSKFRPASMATILSLAAELVQETALLVSPPHIIIQ